MASSLISAFKLPDDYVPPTKPPSARPVETRKSQLLRSYTSLLRSTPLMLMFQTNNLTAVELAAVRRELRFALAAVDSSAATPDSTQPPVDMASYILLQVVRTRMLNQAMKIIEFYDPSKVVIPESVDKKDKNAYKHDLSLPAYEAVKAAEKNIPSDSPYAQLTPVVVGPMAVLTFPTVSPRHLAAALSVLSPNPPAFPPPSRKKRPGYWDMTTQSALQKLLLVGGRVEGKAFDSEGLRWVGGIEGGLDGLRAQLVGMLQNAGLGLTSVLEGASKSLYLTVEGRRTMLEDAEKEGQKKE